MASNLGRSALLKTRVAIGYVRDPLSAEVSGDDQLRRWVRPLAAVGQADLSTAGGKGTNLVELVRAGARVRYGFVICRCAPAPGTAAQRS